MAKAYRDIMDPRWTGSAGSYTGAPQRKPIPVISHEELMQGRRRTMRPNGQTPVNYNFNIPKDRQIREQGNQGTGNINIPYGNSGGASLKDVGIDSKYAGMGYFPKVFDAIKNEQGPLDYQKASSYDWSENLNAKWRQTPSMLAEQTALEGGGNWYDDLWKGAKDLGFEGWGKLGLGTLKAYQGWQAADLAEKQHGLAQKTYDYQTAMADKQYDAQKRTLNNEIRARRELLGSDFYGDPARAQSLKLVV